MQKSITASRGARVIALAAAAILATTLSGCSVIQGVLGSADKPVRDAESQEITEGGQADVFSIKVGDCLNEASGETVTDVPVVPCSEPHDEEAYFEARLDDGAFPGDEAVQTKADEICYGAFTAFAGIAYEDSALDYYPYTPTEMGWNEANDRVVTCIIYDPSAQTTGSLAGAAR